MAARKRPVALLLATESPNALYGLAKNELLQALVPAWHVPVTIKLGARDLRLDQRRGTRPMPKEPYFDLLKATIDAEMRTARLGEGWREQLRLVVAGISFREATGLDKRASLLEALELPDSTRLTVMRERSGKERNWIHGTSMFEFMK